MVTLHPAAIKAYLEAINRLEVALAAHAAEGEDEPGRALRDLVETVTVHSPGSDGVVHVTIAGRLASLVGASLFPSTTVQGGSTVAGEGLSANALKSLILLLFQQPGVDGACLLPQTYSFTICSGSMAAT